MNLKQRGVFASPPLPHGLGWNSTVLGGWRVPFWSPVLLKGFGYDRGGGGWGGENRCREPLCKEVNQRMGGSFSFSWRGILFPLEMEADRKAISVSGFIVLSLEPAKSKHQMSVREHSGFFPPLPIPTSCQKDPKYHSWENRVCRE